MKATVLGIDFGSDSARAVVAEAASGAVVGIGTAGFHRWAAGVGCDPGRQRYRQHPGDHLEALAEAVLGALAAAPAGTAASVAGIGIDTTGSTPLPVDCRGRALAEDPSWTDEPAAWCWLWKDHSAWAEAERLTDLARTAADDVTAWVGGAYSSEWYWAKIARALADRPDLAEAAETWVEHCDWLPAQLCGVDHARAIPRSRCAAGHKGLWHGDRPGGWPPSTLLEQLHPALAGIVEGLPPTTATVDRTVGGLDAAWAKRLGLAAGLPVAGGAFDAHLGAVGAGIAPGTLVKVMGTSTCDMAVAAPGSLAPTPVPGICGQVDGSMLPGLVGLEAGQSAFGDAYAWFQRLLAWTPPGGAGRDDDLLAALGSAAAQRPPGSGGIAVDWFNGRRTPGASAHARGAFTGLHLGLEAPDLFRALVESTACGARAIRDHLAAHRVPTERVVAIGGVANKSPFVVQVHADVLDAPITTLESDACCALGAAMAGATVAGIHPSLQAAQAAMAPAPAEIREPDPAQRAVYDDLYGRYVELATFLDGFDQP